MIDLVRRVTNISLEMVFSCDSLRKEEVPATTAPTELKETKKCVFACAERYVFPHGRIHVLEE